MTDPTNPCHQEAAGIWVPNEQATERRIDEPGLTDYDRDLRKPNPDVEPWLAEEEEP